MDESVRTRLLEQIESIPHDDQQRVLEFARALAMSVLEGVPGKDLLRFAGAVPADDLQLIAKAIEADCERIDFSEW